MLSDLDSNGKQFPRLRAKSFYYVFVGIPICNGSIILSKALVQAEMQCDSGDMYIDFQPSSIFHDV
jgi:hypothetical protein